jgi:hypothetical protein
VNALAGFGFNVAPQGMGRFKEKALGKFVLHD